MSSQEKVKISIAAKRLRVSRKTVYNYLKKEALQGIEDNGKLYVLVDSIREFEKGKNSQGNKSVKENVTSHVTLTRPEYDELIYFKMQHPALLEYKTGQEAKEKEYQDTKIRLEFLENEHEGIRNKKEALETENQKLRNEIEFFVRLPWWKRLFLPKKG